MWKEIREKGILKVFGELIFGQDKETETQRQMTTPQQLQAAAQAEIELANAKAEVATTAMITAQSQRTELAKLVAQHQELGKQALHAEKLGDQAKARKILALQLGIQAKIDAATQQYEQADAAAQQLIKEARDKFQKAKTASTDLPRRVLQLEMNSMLERARKLEDQATQQQLAKPSYKALADSIELDTARLMARSLITEGSANLESEVESVLRAAEFEVEYAKLQQRAKEELPDDAVDAEFTAVEDSVSRAQKLLSQPAFGGLLETKVRVEEKE